MVGKGVKGRGGSGSGGNIRVVIGSRVGVRVVGVGAGKGIVWLKSQRPVRPAPEVASW
jgi:hypothetical protein